MASMSTSVFDGRPGRRAALGLERLEDRTLPAALSFHGGWLSLLGQSATLTSAPDGRVAVRIDSAAATTVPATSLHGIRLTGGGAADVLNLGSLRVPGDLILVSDGAISVKGSVQAGGSLTATSRQFVNLGSLGAGRIALAANDYLNAGTVRAGGVVSVAFGQSYIDTSAADISARQVHIHGSGRLFSSGHFSASGASGGRIDLSGDSVALIAATLDASGSAGKGGRVVIGSQQSTDFTGTISARGGTGGFIEVSSHGCLTDTGKADPGPGGTLLLDPKNLVVAAAPVGTLPQFNLVNPGKGGNFGAEVVPLSTGNIVVTDPKVNHGGAVYLFNGQSGALISALTETGQNTDPGLNTTVENVTALPGGNFVVDNPFWNQFTGAVTWVNGKTGLSGAVSASNSLVGSTSGNFQTGDQVGGGQDLAAGLSSAQDVSVLPSGNYIVYSASWNGKRGAVTWGSGTAGVRGLVSSLNSLVGSSPGDDVGGIPDTIFGSGFVPLSNGNYVVASPLWNNRTGAATWGSGTTGISGTISSGNSLVGSSPGDEVALATNTSLSFNLAGVIPLKNGNYVVSSPLWNNRTGAATWGSGTTGISGTISSGNSLVGTGGGDEVGIASSPFFTATTGGIVPLTNGNYVVASPNYFGGTGAATWGSGTTGVTGIVGPDNSLTGNVNTMTDHVGEGIIALTNGNYVVSSPNWTFNQGAATWGNGTTGTTGVVSSSNSLIGQHQNFFTGDGTGQTITPLANGNYVVVNPDWSNPSGSSVVGAATWGNGAASTSGTISTGNSLVGSSAGDLSGSSVVALSDGNYVLDSPGWNGGAGAVTWGNGTTGTAGTISLNNSLIGSTAGDHVGEDISSDGSILHSGIIVLSSGNYVVDSPSWTRNTGAVTWGSGATGISGVVSAANSLVGSAPGDQVGAFFDFSTGDGSGGVTELANGNYVVASVYWNHDSGAVTWGSGTAGVKGTISSANSLIGAHAGDAVGGLTATFVNGVTALPDGNYVVVSPSFSGGKGAVTWGSGRAGARGIVSTSNSLVGSNARDQLGNAFDNVIVLSDGNYVVNSPDWGGKRGAFTWGSATSGATLDGQHTVDAQNSLLGPVAASGIPPFAIPPLAALPGSFLASFPQAKGGVVTVGLTDPNRLTASLAPTRTLSVTPGFLTRSLDAGTAVDIQASSTLTVSSPIVVSAHGHGGALMLQEGTLLLDAGISTDGGALTLSGSVSPGGSKAALIHLSASRVSFKPHSGYGVQLDGTTAGKGYDQLAVNGVIDLRNATLHVSSKGHFTKGQMFVLIQDTRPIRTTFAGRGEGSLVSAGGQKLKVSYKNDRVTLTVQ